MSDWLGAIGLVGLAYAALIAALGVAQLAVWAIEVAVSALIGRAWKLEE